MQYVGIGISKVIGIDIGYCAKHLLITCPNNIKYAHYLFHASISTVVGRDIIYDLYFLIQYSVRVDELY